MPHSFLQFTRTGRGLALVALASALLLGIVPAALADSQRAAAVILKSQLEFVGQQKVLNRCLAASPTKNTPCTTRASLKLATMADRHIAQISGALDGTEAPCVRTVANQQMTYLRIWRNGALALHRNQRMKARRIFLSSLKVQQALDRTQKPCFLSVFGG